MISSLTSSLLKNEKDDMLINTVNESRNVAYILKSPHNFEVTERHNLQVLTVFALFSRHNIYV